MDEQTLQSVLVAYNRLTAVLDRIDTDLSEVFEIKQEMKQLLLSSDQIVENFDGDGEEGDDEQSDEEQVYSDEEGEQQQRYPVPPAPKKMPAAAHQKKRAAPKPKVVKAAAEKPKVVYKPGKDHPLYDAELMKVYRTKFLLANGKPKGRPPAAWKGSEDEKDALRILATRK